MKKERKYSMKDVDMLMAARTLCKNFEDHKADIVAMRSVWADPYISGLKTRINDAISNYLGQDPKKDLRIATQNLKTIQEDAKRDLSLFKIQVEVDYNADKSRLSWLLTTLGFTEHYTGVQKGDQEALIELLYNFKLNMTAALKTELTGKGIDGTLIDNIKGYANPLRDANTTQENLKGTTQELTEEALTEFNAIYAEAMAICRITSRLFKAKPTVRSKFIFSRLQRRMNRTRGIEKVDIRRGIEGESPENGGIESPTPGIE